MRKVVPTGKFKDDLKKLSKQGANLEALNALIASLRNDEQIHARHNDHQLKGNKKDYRDLHVKGDWILMYRKEGDDKLHLIRTGSHAELFGR